MLLQGASLCVAVCCSELQCVAVCCSVLQCVAEFYSVSQCVAVCCSVLQCVAVQVSGYRSGEGSQQALTLSRRLKDNWKREHS